MKIITTLLSIIGVGLIFFNLTKINSASLFEGDSIIALITIFAALCAIVLLQILRISKRIEKTIN